jgi:hypothetical protein
MGTRLSNWLYRASSGWLTLAALVIFLLFTALALPAQSARSETDAGSPDTSLFYSPADLYAMAEAYGPDGRQDYITARFTFDLVWPLVYLFFLATAISWLFARSVSAENIWRRANLAPLLGALFDYLENVSTALVMGRYPAHTPVVDLLAPAFTFVKWVFVGGSFVLLLAGAAMGLWRWARGRRV